MSLSQEDWEALVAEWRRSGKAASRFITSQLSSKTWHAALGDPTIADAICDRLVHNAHELALTGPSMRKKKAASLPPKH